MSEAANLQRAQAQSWAEPGSRHDRLIGLLKIGLPAAVGVIAAIFLAVPLTKQQEVSFILDKKDVSRAEERMKIEAARYSGTDTTLGLAMAGTGWSGMSVAMMTPPICVAFMPACSSACCTAIAARSVALSFSPAKRRSLMPVRRIISSSVRCGNAFRISLLARTLDGTA